MRYSFFKVAVCFIIILTFSMLKTWACGEEERPVASFRHLVSEENRGSPWIIRTSITTFLRALGLNGGISVGAPINHRRVLENWDIYSLEALERFLQQRSNHKNNNKNAHEDNNHKLKLFLGVPVIGLSAIYLGVKGYSIMSSEDRLEGLLNITGAGEYKCIVTFVNYLINMNS